MNSRLTIQDLAGYLADYTGKDKKETELFLKEFIAVVTEEVYAGRMVKIKGLGTFKIIPVEKRESVHVNTGERFVIPAHYKFSFLPDKELKELVNRPFSFFETTELNEGVDFSDLDESVGDEKETDTEDESVEELVPEKKPEVSASDVIEEEPILQEAQIPSEEETTRKEQDTALQPDPIHPETAEEPTVAEQERASQKEVPVVETPVEQPETTIVVPEEQPSSAEEETLPDKAEPQSAKEETETELSAKEEYQTVEEKESDTQPAIRQSGRSIAGRIWLITVSVTLVLFFLYTRGFFESYLYPKQKIAIIQQDTLPLPTETIAIDSMVLPAQTDTIVPEEESLPPDTVRVEEELETKPLEKVLTKVTIKVGDRLTLISKKYYGDKVFWVYIYEYNRSKIVNPNNIPIGTQIEIPATWVYEIDKNNPASIDKASIKQSELLTRYRN